MKKFRVVLPIQGEVSKIVEAEDERAAFVKAQEQLISDGLSVSVLTFASTVEELKSDYSWVTVC